uniref:EF-hand domain-containing protein n=1 Tax=Panagrellus redivivus TaxID=6233 RepID=A0A7E4VBV3_PANRE
MTQYFSKAEIDEFRQCFNLYSSEGFVTNDAQLRYILRTLGCSPTVPETKRYVKQFGASIDFAKFLEIVHLENQKPSAVSQVAQALENLDQYSRGYISAHELTTLLTSFGEKMGKAEVATILRAMRASNDVIPFAKITQFIDG